MGKTMCKEKGKKEAKDEAKHKDKKFKCKKCGATSDKEKRLCKPEKNK